MKGLAAGMLLAASLSVVSAVAAEPSSAPQSGAIRLIVQGDDLGSSHAANEAILRCYKQGILRTAEVMAPCPWFEEAARLCKENPGLEVGVHLTLTSEWDNVKWRPISHAPSLVDRDGYFFQMNSRGWPPGAQWPPGSTFDDARVKPDEVERELRAQIELVRRKIKNVTHLSAHMGTANRTPELRKIVVKLAREYRLLIFDDLARRGLRPIGPWGSGDDAPDAWAAALAGRLGKLTPGTWIVIEHPGLDTPEMQAMGHFGYTNVAAQRWAVTCAFTSPQVQEIVRQRGIQLITHADLR